MTADWRNRGQQSINTEHSAREQIDKLSVENETTESQHTDTQDTSVGGYYRGQTIYTVAVDGTIVLFYGRLSSVRPTYRPTGTSNLRKDGTLDHNLNLLQLRHCAIMARHQIVAACTKLL